MTVRKVGTSGTKGMGLGICGGFGAVVVVLVEAARVVLRRVEGEEEGWKKACCGMEIEEGERTPRRC